MKSQDDFNIVYTISPIVHMKESDFFLFWEFNSSY